MIPCLRRRWLPLLFVLGAMPAIAQQSTLPNVVTGLDSHGGQATAAVGNGSDGHSVPMPVQPTASGLSGGGIAPVVGTGVSNVIGKAAAGNLYSFYTTTDSTHGVWLFAINATSAPANATLTAGAASGNFEDCVYVNPASSGGASYPVGTGKTFSVGITIVASSTACPVLTATTTPIFLSVQAQ